MRKYLIIGDWSQSTLPYENMEEVAATIQGAC